MIEWLFIIMRTFIPQTLSQMVCKCVCERMYSTCGCVFVNVWLLLSDPEDIIHSWNTVGPARAKGMYAKACLCMCVSKKRMRHPYNFLGVQAECTGNLFILVKIVVRLNCRNNLFCQKYVQLHMWLHELEMFYSFINFVLFCLTIGTSFSKYK